MSVAVAVLSSSSAGSTAGSGSRAAAAAAAAAAAIAVASSSSSPPPPASPPASPLARAAPIPVPAAGASPRRASPAAASPAPSSGSWTPPRAPSPTPTTGTSSSVSAPSSPGAQPGVYSYLDSFIKSLNKVLSAEGDPAATSPPPSAGAAVVSPTSPSGVAGGTGRGDWQASYLSPVHTKLKREGRQLEPHREKDINALRAKFNGVLPFFRVWELKVEEMDSEAPTMGRGTPPRPHRQIFTRELSATRLFLKDYQKRRGMTRLSNGVNETEMDPSSLRRAVRPKPMPTAINPEPSVPKGKTAKTQSLSPELLIERRKAAPPVRQHSKLHSSLEQ